MRSLVAGALAVAVAAAGTVAGADTSADNPLARAREASQRVSFVGVVDVAWSDSTGSHDDELVVRGAGGSLEVQGETTVMAASGGDRMVRRQGGDWDLLWSGSQASGDRPDPTAKYTLVTATDPGPAVVSRPTRLVEVRQGPVLRERLFLDETTGLVLRREQLDRTGRPIRVVAFSALTVDPPQATIPVPARAADRTPRSVAVSGSPAAPPTLPGAYRRVSAFQESDALQVLYSDGLYDLSVFEQPGRLRASDVPSSGDRVGVGRRRGWIYSWAGGHVLLWHAGHTLYSLVSDAPVDHLLEAASALPASGRSPSLLNRLRRACRALVEPFGP